MKKFWKNLGDDLWIVLLDVVAVNAAYVLALLIRFYVNFEFRPSVNYYLTDWLRFTPFYTVLCILVFALFRLYGGMWRYAGINDMNRIIAANAVTVVIQVLGTLIVLGFRRRMPFTYYIIGAVLQFLMISLIRFGYRMLLVEKNRISRRKAEAVPAVVVGSGEMARRAIRYLEENSACRVKAVVDPAGAGKNLDGVPVVEDWKKAMKSAHMVVVADPHMPEETRQQIRKAAEAEKLEWQDVTGFLSNLGGRVSLTALLELAEGPVTVAREGKETFYANGEEALSAVTGRREIVSVRNLTVDLAAPSQGIAPGDESWARQHQQETGEEISFF